MMPWSMVSRSGTTNLAIVGGALLGVVGALFAGKPKPERPKPVVVAKASAPITPPPSATPAPAASSAEVFNADEGNPMLSDAAVDPRQAELDCARGVTRMCLAGAAALREADAGQGRVLENLAVAQWSAACTARDAEACQELANLHERGIGVPPSAERAKGLRERARDLCKQKPSAFCDTLQKEPP